MANKEEHLEEIVMRNKPVLLSALVVVGLVLGSGAAAFAQTPVIQNRVAQQVVISGVRADAAYVLAPGGGIQSYTCPNPQQYVTPDGASQGWACFDAATNVWLLSALPPQQAPAPPAPIVVQQVVQQPVYQTPPVIYEVAQPTVIYRQSPQIIYAAPYYPRGVYASPSVAIGVASINAAGRIAAAVIDNSRYGHDDHRSVRVFQSRGRR
jgi:hypothetical protein